MSKQDEKKNEKRDAEHEKKAEPLPETTVIAHKPGAEKDSTANNETEN